jgi:tetratricopeptide (TPR) repeat protein
MKPKNFLVALFVALLPISGFGQSTPVPLSRAEILGRLALAQPPSGIAHLVKTRGITFSVSDDFLSDVKRAGGDGILVERLGAASISNSSQSFTEPGGSFEHLAKCAELLHIGDTEQAIRECRASIDENPQSAWPLLATNCVLESMNVPQEEKTDLLRRAVAVAPNQAEAHLALSMVLPNPAESGAEMARAAELESPDQVEDPEPLQGRVYSGSPAVRRYSVAEDAPPRDANELNPGLQHLLETESDLASTHVIVAYQFLQSGNVEKCLSEFKEALRLEPDNPQLHGIIAQFYGSQQKIEEEIAELREVVQIVPYGYEQRQTLALTFQSQGRTVEAINEWRDMLSLSPRNVQASDALVELYMQQNDRKSAIAELRRSLTASSIQIGDDAKYVDERLQDLDHLAHLLTDNRDFKAAGEQYLFLLRFKPDSGELHNNYGNVLYAQKRVDEAIPEYREALRLKPDLPDAHHNLANCLLLKSKADDALEEYQQTVELDPQKFNSRLMVGVSLMQKGDLGSAIGQFQQLLQEKPEDPDLHFALAHAYYLNKDIPSAVEELTHSLKIRPDSPNTENELAWIYATSSDPQYRKPSEALTLAKRAVQSSKEPVPAILDTLAEALLINDQPQEALKTEEQATKLAPDDHEMQSRLKRFQEAVQQANLR